MFRFALTIYLTLATLAGQWLCCCSANRLSNLIGQSTKEVGEIGKAGSSSCCGHRHAAATHDSGAKPHTAPAQPNRPACPCQEHRSEQVAGLAVDSETAKQLRTAEAPGDSFVSFAGGLPLAVVNHLPCTDSSGIHYQTVQDLLSLFQTLRC